MHSGNSITFTFKEEVKSSQVNSSSSSLCTEKKRKRRSTTPKNNNSNTNYLSIYNNFIFKQQQQFVFQFYALIRNSTPSPPTQQVEEQCFSFTFTSNSRLWSLTRHYYHSYSSPPPPPPPQPCLSVTSFTCNSSP